MKRLILCLIAVLFLFSLTYASEITKMSVDFKDADLRSVFRLISDIAKGDGIEIYIDPDIKGKITIKKINTPWNDILSEIGEKFHLLAALKGTRLFIYEPSNHEKLKKQFNFDTDMVSGSKKSSQSNLPSDGRPIKLTLKNGNTMTWSNYTEEADQYCTQKSIGLFCIPKNSVASIVAKEEENPDAIVIVNKTSDAEKEASQNELLDSRKKKECEEMRTKINSLKVSFEELFALSNKYDNECLTPEQRKQLKEKKRNARIEGKLNIIQMKINQQEIDRNFGKW